MMVSPSGSAAYAYLMARSRLMRRAEWVLKVLGRFLPGRIRGKPFLVFGVCMLGGFVFECVAFGAALFGLLLLASPPVALSLMFAFLLAGAIGVGLSTVRRTIAPPDLERLLAAPIPDRRAYSLVFFGGGLMNLLESALAMPVVAGIAATAILEGRVAAPMLWISVVLVVLAGLPLALVVDRLMGALRVRRVRAGTRTASFVGYVLFSGLALGIGALLAGALVPWVAAAPKDLGSLTGSGQGVRWASSIGGYASDALAPLGSVISHPFSPAGALARGALGDFRGLLLAALWVAVAWALAAVLWTGGGRWYRGDWLNAWQGWARGDVFSFAEGLYVPLARFLYRGDSLVETQIRNLCRRREWVVASAFDLFGGSFSWLWVGLALGAAPTLQGNQGGAAAFALVVGGWAAMECSRGPFVNFEESLSLDAEGRRAGLYRAAGLGVYDLYRAKLRAGRLVGGVPLVATLILVAVAAGLPPASWALIAAAGAASWIVGPHVELLPGLVSPHFGWEHPDDIGDYHEQAKVQDWVGRSIALLFFAELGLVTSLFEGWISPASFAWAACGVVALLGFAAELAFRLLGRRAAGYADKMDFPA